MTFRSRDMLQCVINVKRPPTDYILFVDFLHNWLKDQSALFFAILENAVATINIRLVLQSSEDIVWVEVLPLSVNARTVNKSTSKRNWKFPFQDMGVSCSFRNSTGLSMIMNWPLVFKWRSWSSLESLDQDTKYESGCDIHDRWISTAKYLWLARFRRLNEGCEDGSFYTQGSIETPELSAAAIGDDVGMRNLQR